ncbi:hypothetical protein Tco_0123488 [Tanacetum coccineum]
MHRLRGGMSMIQNLMHKLLLLVQKLMILLLKLKCTSEGVQQRQKIKKKGRGFPEQKSTFPTISVNLPTVNVPAEDNVD